MKLSLNSFLKLLALFILTGSAFTNKASDLPTTLKHSFSTTEVDDFSLPPNSYTLVLTPPYDDEGSCYIATLKDTSGTPIAGHPIAFHRYGPNGTHDTTIFTDAFGEAANCFTQINYGIDSVIATVGGVSDTSYFEWVCYDAYFLDCVPNILINTSSDSVVNYTFEPRGTLPEYSYAMTGATVSSGSGTGSGTNFQPGLTYVSIYISNACGSDTCSFTVYLREFDCGDDPVGSHVYTGNVTISTQTQAEQFVGNNNDSNQNRKYTKIVGNLTLIGNDANDPIVSLCNLSEIVEVTGNIEVNYFTKEVNPYFLEMFKLKTVGGGFRVADNTKLTYIRLYVEEIGTELSVQSNDYLRDFRLYDLKGVGNSVSARNNPHLYTFYVSNGAFKFTGNTNSVNFYNNGWLNYNKIGFLLGVQIDMYFLRKVKGNFQVSKNALAYGSFGNMFFYLDSIYGSMSINNNYGLNSCCPAVNAYVGNKRNIRNNTNSNGSSNQCPDLATAQSYCINVNKRGGKSEMVNDDMFTDLSINPSPNNGNFELYVNTLQEGTVNVMVTDMLGREVYRTSKDVQEDVYIPINMDNAAEGQYILKAELNGKVQFRRLMITNK
ncbi:MAG: T9SS type A sorting domain-containing protein [Flavobacteriales bacterium]|nr:T9SS type A sorting domain-containing protein [Flavobacteriales bacterium]